jgi:SAM-dependent methyltransferase
MGIDNAYYFIRKGLHEKISQYSKELDGRLLDFGCGTKPYQSLFTNATEYIGVDYEGEGHDHKDEPVDIFYDGINLPFEDAKFDSVFSSEVFEHLFFLPRNLAEIHRVLKPGGKLLITVPFAWPEHEIPIDYARYTRFALADMLFEKGFEIISIDKSGHYVQALHQLFMDYLQNVWVNRVAFLSKHWTFRKLVFKAIIPMLNFLFRLTEPLWPRSDRFYLNTIVLASKKS